MWEGFIHEGRNLGSNNDLNGAFALKHLGYSGAAIIPSGFIEESINQKIHAANPHYITCSTRPSLLSGWDIG